MKEYGKKTWLIPDCFCPAVSTVGKSHDAVCVLNTTACVAELRLTLYFEDREKFTVESSCPPEATHHIRMDKITDADGKELPKDVPYAVLLESSCPVVVQYSRLDTSLGNEALMTTIAYPVEE